MKVKSESEVAQSCLTLRDPLDCSLPGSSSMGFSRQEYWSGVPLPSPDSPLTFSSKIDDDRESEVGKSLHCNSSPTCAFSFFPSFSEYLLCLRHREEAIYIKEFTGRKQDKQTSGCLSFSYYATRFCFYFRFISIFVSV